MPSKNTIVVLFGVVVLAAVLRGWQLGESLWLDELHTSWTVSSSLLDVAPRATIGNQSPLYFWLAWFFARLPLPGEIALRLPSMLAGCGLPIAVFWLARILSPKEKGEPNDDTVPLLAAFLVAIDPRAIFYSQEARPYAILMLIAVVHFGVLLMGLERSTRPVRTAWVVTGALLVHLHYTGGLILLAEFVALALLSLSDARNRLNPIEAGKPALKWCSNCLVDIGALAVLLLPSIPGMLAVAGRRENWNHFVHPQPWYEILRLFPWTPAIIGILALNSWRPKLTQLNLALLGCWILVPLITAWSLTEFNVARLFHQRYIIAVLPATLIAAALCARLGVNAATQSILVGLILAISVANGGIVQTWRQYGKILNERKEDWRAAMATLNMPNQMMGGDTAILVRSGFIEADDLPRNTDPLFQEYCLCPVRGLYRLKHTDFIPAYPLTTTDPGKLSPDFREKLQRADSIFLLVRTSQASVREQLLHDLKESITGNGTWEPHPPEQFGNLYLQRINLRKPLPPTDK